MAEEKAVIIAVALSKKEEIEIKRLLEGKNQTLNGFVMLIVNGAYNIAKSARLDDTLELWKNSDGHSVVKRLTGAIFFRENTLPWENPEEKLTVDSEIILPRKSRDEIKQIGLLYNFYLVDDFYRRLFSIGYHLYSLREAYDQILVRKNDEEQSLRFHFPSSMFAR